MANKIKKIKQYFRDPTENFMVARFLVDSVQNIQIKTLFKSELY